MRRTFYLLISCLLLCSTTSYADQLDNGPAWESCKVFDLGKLDIKAAHVSPALPALDTSLSFDRMQMTAGTSPARSQFERFHAHTIDAGSRLRLMS